MHKVDSRSSSFDAASVQHQHQPYIEFEKNESTPMPAQLTNKLNEVSRYFSSTFCTKFNSFSHSVVAFIHPNTEYGKFGRWSESNADNVLQPKWICTASAREFAASRRYKVECDASNESDASAASAATTAATGTTAAHDDKSKWPSLYDAKYDINGRH